MFKHLFILVSFLSLILATPIKPLATPSCKSCHPVDPSRINVHLIPHSHDDVGWLKTLDQYYYGHRNDIQKAGVQYIISSTVEALKANPNRRFIQVETAFFWKWWQRQNAQLKQDFSDLVNNGQIEITNAAWSMNDEAAVNYHSTIDQFTWGLRIINDTLGTCGIPRVGWQIDPFGHAREHTSILAQLGYDGVFFARLDYIDKINRIVDKTMEVVWQGSANLNNSNVFTNIFPEFYYPPGGFCFDIECGDEVINDDIESPEYNVPRRVDSFAMKVQELATFYRTSNLLIPMGGDFQFQAAEKNFINMDKLIEAFAGHPTVNVLYSTPSCYIQAVNDEALNNGVEFVVKTDDFFPYASDPHCYWTGYFTSRPNAKRFERVSNNILQAGKQLASIAKVNGNNYDNLITPLREAVGVLQHHDAITGTAKQHVAKDYSRLLTKGIKIVEPVIADQTINLLKKNNSVDLGLNLQTCLQTNISVCDITTVDRFVVTIYNPLARPVTHYVRLPIPGGTYKVTGNDGIEEAVDILDSISNFTYLDGSNEKPNPKELVFAAKNIPPLGVKLYYVERISVENIEPKRTKQTRFGTETTGFEIDPATGLLSSVTMNGKTVAITQEFLYYEGANGNNSNVDDRASGAYIFRPKQNQTFTLSPGANVTYTATIGNVVDQVHQIINEWVTQIITVYKGTDGNFIEFDWLVGPIEVDMVNMVGREIVSRFTVDGIDSNGTFYTDSNGREMIKRQINARYDYTYDSSYEPVASNYYPVTSKIAIKDVNQNLEIALLNDRAQGGSSLENGQIELMVHRRLLKDDDKGVAEALNDTEYDIGIVARGQHYLVIGDLASAPGQERDLALKKLLAPVVLVADATAAEHSLDNIQNNLNFNFSGLNLVLPDNIHILTLEPWKDDTFLLRLEHVFEKNEDAILSQPQTVDLTGLFTLFEVSEMVETTLGANEVLTRFENREKFVWNLEGGTQTDYKKSTNSVERANEIYLEPMQIRTFIVRVTKTV